MKILVSAVALLATAQIAMSAHANSWAGEDTSPLGANHDSNQSRSIDTPGEDEMNGLGAHASHGKNGTTPNGGTASGNSGLGEGGGPSGSSGQGGGGGRR
ncbi:hypothetical protein AB9K41_17105 [Cribrihabitans sp. XS_ASV171]